VAHELRNPLAAINLAAHNIKRKANNPDLEKHLATIGKKVSESGQIINNLLFYSRLKPPHREPVDLFGVIEEALDMMEEGLKKPVSVVRNFDVLKNLSIDADPVQIKEVFHNILNNAQDAVPDDGGRIRVTAENGGEFIRVAIEDNGPGMGKDVLEKVFDPFFTTKAKGTGLGLSVCKQIVAMHEGDIEIKSEPGRGSSVIVRLRVKEKTGAK
jgi:signal transduction histidine kinase